MTTPPGNKADTVAVRLDLDYMLLDTDRWFFGGVRSLLAREFGVNLEAFTASMTKHSGDEDRQGGYYDFFGHLAAERLDGDTVSEAIRSELSGDHFLYPGARDFVQMVSGRHADVSILTKVEARYQRLKYSCLPTLAGLAFESTNGIKGEYLVGTMPEARGIMVDDNIVSPLPGGMVQAHIRHDDRPAAYHGFDSLIQNWDALVQTVPDQVANTL